MIWKLRKMILGANGMVISFQGCGFRNVLVSFDINFSFGDFLVVI